jgi:signal transduction histidine kinase
MDDDLPGQYRSALLSYLADQHESTLNRSYEIGRQALSSRMGILDVLNVHHEVIFDLLRENRASEPEKLVELGKCFLAECLSPFEMMRMSNRETTAALRRLNEMLEAQARRIAHDLHDEFAQLLATVYLELAEINRQSTSDSIHTLVEQITSHLDMARDHLRRLSH